MATYSTEPQKRYKFAAETLHTGVGFARRLRSGIILTGTPTVTTGAGPTISNIGLNAAAVVLNGESHAIGTAVMFTIAGGTATTTYDLAVTATTNGSPAETLKEVCAIEVK